MRIGFEAKRAFHNFRGLGNYSRTLVEGLVDYYPNNKYFLYTTPFKSQQSFDWSRELGKRDEVDIYVRRPESFIDRKFPALWRSAFQVSDVTDDNLDIYHGLSHELPFGIEKSGAAAIVTIHDLIFLRLPELFPWVDRKVYHYKFKKACERAVKIIAICEQTKKDLISLLGVNENKIRVLYQSCHPRFYHMLSPEKRHEVLEQNNITRPYILYVGAFEQRKNILDLINAYASSKSRNNVDLVLVGSGTKSYLEKIKNLIGKLGVEKKVHILGNISNEDLPSLYQSSKLFVFPSSFEGFGLPIVEALFSRVPVITSKGSCFPESGGPKTCYITPGDIDEISQKIDLILSDEKLADDMVQMGHKYVQRFHLKNTTDELIDFYRSLV